MSSVPANVETALICNHLETFDCESLIFKIAVAFALQGSRVEILLQNTDHEVNINKQYLSHPEILKRINISYIKSCNGLIQWCHEIHTLQKKPTVLLVPLNKFCVIEEFEAVSISAALIDAILYLSKQEICEQFYLLATVTLSSDSSAKHLQTFYNYLWSSNVTKSSVLLKRTGEKSRKAQFITISDKISFEEVKKIFLGNPNLDRFFLKDNT